MEKLVIYYRVSTESQDEESQLLDLENWSEINGFEVVKVFGEKVSGFDPDVEREELEKCKSFVIENGIKTVLVWELSRLGRSALQTLQHIEFFSQHGVNIIFKKEGLHTLSDNFTNKLVISLLSSIAEMERNTIVQRTKRGMMSSAMKNKRMGYSKLPLGYTSDDNGYIIINNEEADLVRSMYKAVASGISAGRLAKDLNAKGVPTYSDKAGKIRILRNGTVVPNRWNGRTVKHIIKNTRNKGSRSYAGLEIPVPRIVDDQLWEEANKRLDEHIGYISRTKYDYLFKSKIICGHCGYTMKALRKYSRTRQEVTYYQCFSILQTGVNCDCGRFRSKVFDDFLYEVIFAGGKGISTAVKKENSEGRKAEIIKKIGYWNTEKDNLLKEQSRIKKLFIKGFIEEKEMEADLSKVVVKINEADLELSGLNSLLSGLNHPRILPEDTLKKYYLNADYGMRRSFVEEYVQRIRVYKVKEVNIDLKGIHYFEVPWYDRSAPAKEVKFRAPKKNEVAWYVEVWAYDDPEPYKAFMTSATGMFYTNDRLIYDPKARSIAL